MYPSESFSGRGAEVSQRSLQPHQSIDGHRSHCFTPDRNTLAPQSEQVRHQQNRCDFWQGNTGVYGNQGGGVYYSHPYSHPTHLDHRPPPHYVDEGSYGEVRWGNVGDTGDAMQNNVEVNHVMSVAGSQYGGHSSSTTNNHIGFPLGTNVNAPNLPRMRNHGGDAPAEGSCEGSSDQRAALDLSMWRAKYPGAFADAPPESGVKAGQIEGPSSSSSANMSSCGTHFLCAEDEQRIRGARRPPPDDHAAVVEQSNDRGYSLHPGNAPDGGLLPLPGKWSGNSLMPPDTGPTDVTPMNADAAISRNKTLSVLPSTEEMFESRRILAQFSAMMYRQGVGVHGDDVGEPGTPSSSDMSRTGPTAESTNATAIKSESSAAAENTFLEPIDFSAQKVDELTCLDEYPPTPTPVHSANIPLTFHQAFHRARAGHQAAASLSSANAYLTQFPSSDMAAQEGWGGSSAPPLHSGDLPQTSVPPAGTKEAVPTVADTSAPTIPHLFSPTPAAPATPSTSPPMCPMPPPVATGEPLSSRANDNPQSASGSVMIPNYPAVAVQQRQQLCVQRPPVAYFYSNTASLPSQNEESPALPAFPAYGSTRAPHADFTNAYDNRLPTRSVFGCTMSTGGFASAAVPLNRESEIQSQEYQMTGEAAAYQSGGHDGIHRGRMLTEVGGLHGMTDVWTSSTSSAGTGTNGGPVMAPPSGDGMPNPRFAAAPLSHGIFRGGPTLATTGYTAYPTAHIPTGQSPFVSPSPNVIPVPPFHATQQTVAIPPRTAPIVDAKIGDVPSYRQNNRLHGVSLNNSSGTYGPNGATHGASDHYARSPDAFDFFKDGTRVESTTARPEERSLAAAPASTVYLRYDNENEHMHVRRGHLPPSLEHSGEDSSLVTNATRALSEAADPHMESLAKTATRTAATAFVSPILDPGENTVAVVSIMRAFERYENAANHGQQSKEEISERLKYELHSSERRTECSPLAEWGHDSTLPLPAEPYGGGNVEDPRTVYHSHPTGTESAGSVRAALPKEHFMPVARKEDFSQLAKTAASCDGHPIALKTFYDGNNVDRSEDVTPRESTGLNVSLVTPPPDHRSGAINAEPNILASSPVHVRAPMTTPTGTPHSEELQTVSPSTTATSPDRLTQSHTGSSIGASLHPVSCKPCAFVWTKGCINGKDCQFCHEWHLPKKKKPMKDQKNLMIIARPDGKIEFLRCTIEEALRVSY